MTFRSLIILWLIVVVHASQGDRGVAADPPNVLDVPMILQQQANDNLRAVVMLRKGEYENAKLLLRQCVVRMPQDLMAVYNLACAHAKLDQSDEAFEMLRAALKLGFRSKEQMQMDDDLASLRDKPEFAEILKGCDEPPPKRAIGWNYDVQIAQPQGSAFAIDHNNMSWNTANHVMQVFVDSSTSGHDRLSAGTTGELGDKIMSWNAEGTAAGNVGDLYDNHDRGHSALDLARYPQLSQIVFGPEVKKRSFDNGPQRLFLYLNAQLNNARLNNNAQAKDAQIKSDSPEKPAASSEATASPAVPTSSLQISRTIVLGNSSTAVTGSPFWRSMPRLILTSAGGPEVLVQHYTHNHLYVYPEHKDHDPGHDDANGWGDVFFANTPYYLISQGSSGTDQPFLDALAATLSAFHPETKKVLRERGLMAPTLQMIFRRCYKLVKTDQDYLTGVAHPTVFEGNQIDRDAMVEMAHSMKADDIPPVAMMKVVSETPTDPTRDYFDAQPSENPLTSLFAISRICHATTFWREITISTADSLDVKRRELKFHWVILRGDPSLITLEDVADRPATKRIRVGYHPRRPIAPGSALESSRVDIAVFAHNGVSYSAPSFLSFMFPENETRVYDDMRRIVSVDYRTSSGIYVDPALVAERLWKDDYHYDSAGKLTGWTRSRGQKQEEFNANGELLGSDTNNESPMPKRVIYQRLNHKDGRPFILQKVVDE